MKIAKIREATKTNTELFCKLLRLGQDTLWIISS